MGGIRVLRVAREAACALALPVVLLAAPAAARADQPASVEDMRSLTIEQLGQIQVTSVSKQAQPLSKAAAAIYVITHDEIARSGALTLPEILRLAPNLQVYQTGASSYVITARGFNGSAQAQNFSNKLLVLIDGRSVYTPMFSGVYWDLQDVVAEDIDRIEVISGPGATLWGANAVNGVINVITRKADDTQGGLVDVAGGNLDGALTVRYGGRVGDRLAWRAYFKEAVGAATELASGATAHDSWSRPQGGFRLDWTPSPADTVSLEGDALSADEAQGGAPNQDIQGRNLTGRWQHALADGHTLQVLAYYDFEQRVTQDGGGSFHVDTFDVQAQDGFSPNDRHSIVFGGEARVSRYAIVNAQSLLFQPDTGDLRLFDVFAQDSIAVTRTLQLIAGLKLEDDPYSGVSFLPDVRLAWNPRSDLLIWAAASRAIRSPTPFDEDVIEKAGPKVFLTGNPNFRPETLTAFQVGARSAVTSRASVSASAYYNLYDDLRSIEPTPGTFTPIYWGNGLRGETYGVEAWADWQALSWWRLSPSIGAMHEDFRFKPGASGLLGVQQVADDPKVQARLKSSMNLGSVVTLDTELRYVSALPGPVAPAYVELNARLGFNLTPRLQLSVDGFNLLHARHQELPAPAANAVPRSVLGELRWRF